MEMEDVQRLRAALDILSRWINIDPHRQLGNIEDERERDNLILLADSVGLPKNCTIQNLDDATCGDE